MGALNFRVRLGPVAWAAAATNCDAARVEGARGGETWHRVWWHLWLRTARSRHWTPIDALLRDASRARHRAALKAAQEVLSGGR